MQPKIIPTLEAKISLSRLSHNLGLIRKTVAKDVTIMAVVKSNAYGHGLIPICRHLAKNGVKYFGVARLEEALAVKKSLPKTAILILSPIPPENFTIALSHHLTLTVSEKKHLKLLAKEAARLKTVAQIHLKVDTGLNRSGVEPEAVLPFIQLAASFENISFEGIFTHFANASSDRAFTLKQLAAFRKIIADLKDHQILPQFIHAAATAAIFKYPEGHFNLVRPGLGLYGHFPDHGQTCNLKPILSLYARISRLHQIEKGETVGYDRTFIAPKKVLLATIAVGYADGLRRSPKPWPYVSIHGQTAPIVGRISMDQTTIDISKIKPKPNYKTPIFLIDNHTDKDCSLKTIAKKIGTSPYEILTSLSEGRIYRSYTH